MVVSLAAGIRKIYKRKNEFTVISDSMAPVLKKGDKVTIFPDARPRFCDVVAYLDNDRVVLHRYYFRVHLKGKVWAITRGDKCKYFDAPWDWEFYLGKTLVKSRNNYKLIAIWKLITAISRQGVYCLRGKSLFFSKII